jgi:hypothetical protein
MRELWFQYKQNKAEQKRAKKWTDEFGAALKALSGDAQEFRLDGEKVAMLVAGQLNRSTLAKEQPDVVKRYTRMVTKEVFDEVWFKEEMPEMYKQYQAQRLVLTGESE